MNGLKMEASLRIVSMVLWALTACLVGFDSQTKAIFYTYTRKATFYDLNALYVLVWINTAAAVYNLLQLFTSYKKDQAAASNYVPIRVLAAAYLVFAGNKAAVQASVLAVSGKKSFHWMKQCNRFPRFCVQTGGGLICWYVSAVLLAITASISAYFLFKLYSPKQFLKPKGK